MDLGKGLGVQGLGLRSGFMGFFLGASRGSGCLSSQLHCHKSHVVWR